MASTGRRCSPHPPLLSIVVAALIFLVASSELPPSANTQSQSQDVKKLWLFRDSVVQDSFAISAFSSWNSSDVNPCGWRGVTCTNFSASVVSLSLPGLGLRGIITASGLAEITTLQSLDLSGNKFSGVLPSNLSSGLKLCNFSGNNFSGSVPADLFRSNSSGSFDLQVLDLSNNNLSGNFPQNILLRSPGLTHLDVAHNQLLGTFANLRFPSSLRSLNLYQNNFTGALPLDIGDNLVNLALLNVGANRLNGQIPSSIGNLTSLHVLVLEKNGLSGEIPFSVGKLKKLLQISLGENWINGTIPNSLFNCSNLQLLHLQRNNLTGSLPAGLRNLRNLTALNLQSNELGGFIPPELGKCTALTSLNVAENKFDGSIPEEIGELANLREVILHSNDLAGRIPSSVSALAKLEVVSISNNRLTGEIPVGMALLPQLQVLDASGNSLQGQIPQQLGMHSRIREIDFSFNQLLNGSIPAGLCSGGHLRILNLAGNNLSQGFAAFLNGSLQCGSLVSLELGLNNLDGLLPSEINLLANATVLDLSHNRLSGPIPRELGSLSKLEVLNLSSNHLSGAVPLELAGMPSLKIVNISNNFLTGPLPSSPAFSGSPASSFSGNSDLCGPPLDDCWRTDDRFASSPPAPSPLAADAEPSAGSLSAIQRDWPLLVAAAVVGILVSVLLFHLIARASGTGSHVQLFASGSAGPGDGPMKKSMKRSPRVSPCNEGPQLPVAAAKDIKAGSPAARALEPEISFSRSLEMNPYSASLDDVVEQLFNQEHAITRNKYSTIYRVASAESENRYVIKKLKIHQAVLEAHEEEIFLELEALQKFSHKHVMRPVHFFIHNARMLLMYTDCFPNGALRQLLDAPLANPAATLGSPVINAEWAESIYSSISADLTPQKKGSNVNFSSVQLVLDWDRRYKIALGLALAIQELHQREPPLVHLDISSNNVLIDEHFQPHLGDMELSKILDPTKVHSQYITSLPGSTGYIAPGIFS